MINAIIETLKIMGWLGVILGILMIVNTICGTVYNICNKKEKFSWKKMLRGLAKGTIFYLSAALTSVAFTMLPYINNMITKTFGTELLTKDLLNSLSSIGILSIVIATITVQGKKAIVGLIELSGVKSETGEEVKEN